jgi:hypothetical protein
MSRLRHPLIVATLIAISVVLIVLALAPSWVARSIAADLRQRIDAAQEPVAASLIEPLAALDAAAVPHLIDLLDDSRAAVRQATRRAMAQRLAAWSDQRTTASQRNIEQLAALLATHQPPAEFHDRAFVKLLALKLLRCSDRVSDTERAQFLANCSTILERALNATDEESTAAAPQPTSNPVIFEINETSPAAIAYEPFSPSDDIADENETEASVTDSDEEDSPPPAPIELYRPRRINSPQLDLPAAQVDDAALRALSTRQLIRRLHDTPAVVLLAENELRRRGFDDETLKVARGLDDADPRVRQQLAESLPGMSSIDPAPWLWELAEDEDENVRRTARNILATSSNPQTRARVGRLK